MTRRAIALASVLGALLLAPQPSVGDDRTAGGSTEATIEPIVDLFSRVPRRWVSAEADELLIQSPRLLRVLPERCHTRGGYRAHCSGERRVAEPSGEAAVRAQRLALGHRASALQLRHGGAFPEWLEVVAEGDRNPKLDWPLPGGRMGRGFGRVRQGEIRHRRHNGVDIGGDEGMPIHAARGGLVVYSDNGLTGYGNAVTILHRDDSSTFYAHCSRTLVAAGELVERGQIIAEVGNTGFPENPHLHFEWRLGGWARDPGPEFINRR
ncbi:MAG: M23 family metallopeptidase [Myxococcota bacterium]